MSIIEQVSALADEIKRLVEENAQLRAQLESLRAPILALADTLRANTPLAIESTVSVRETNAGGAAAPTGGEPGPAPQTRKSNTPNKVTPEMVARWKAAKKEGLSVAAIAREAGVDWSTVSKHLSKSQRPTVEAMLAAAESLEIPPDVVTPREGHCRRCGVLLTATDVNLPAAQDGLCGYCVEERAA